MTIYVVNFFYRDATDGWCPDQREFTTHHDAQEYINSYAPDDDVANFTISTIQEDQTDLKGVCHTSYTPLVY